jgi:hypothetical protein
MSVCQMLPWDVGSRVGARARRDPACAFGMQTSKQSHINKRQTCVWAQCQTHRESLDVSVDNQVLRAVVARKCRSVTADVVNVGSALINHIGQRDLVMRTKCCQICEILAVEESLRLGACAMIVCQKTKRVHSLKARRQGRRMTRDVQEGGGGLMQLTCN